MYIEPRLTGKKLADSAKHASKWSSAAANLSPLCSAIPTYVGRLIGSCVLHWLMKDLLHSVGPLASRCVCLWVSLHIYI